MEVSIVRQRVLDAIARAKGTTADRRERTDKAGLEYQHFLDRVAVPLFKQLANILRVEGHAFNVFTPSGSVRLMSERGSDDYIEITFDARGGQPNVIGRTSRAHGGNVTQSERALNTTHGISELTDEELLAFLLREIEPFL